MLVSILCNFGKSVVNTFLRLLFAKHILWCLARGRTRDREIVCHFVCLFCKTCQVKFVDGIDFNYIARFYTTCCVYMDPPNRCLYDNVMYDVFI